MACYFWDFFDGFIDLFKCVCCHERIAYQRIFGAYRRCNHRIDKYAVVHEHTCERESLHVVTHVKRNDWSFGRTDFETCFFKSFFGTPGICPELIFSPCFFGHHIKCRQHTFGGSRSDWSTEYQGSRSMFQIIDNIFVGSDKSANCTLLHSGIEYHTCSRTHSAVRRLRNVGNWSDALCVT